MSRSFTHILTPTGFLRAFAVLVCASFVMGSAGETEAKAGAIGFSSGGHISYFAYEYELPAYRHGLRAYRPPYIERRQDYGRGGYRSCHKGRALRKFLVGRTLKGRSFVSGRIWKASFFKEGRVRYTYANGKQKWAGWRLQNSTVRIAFPGGPVAFKKVCRRDGRFQWVTARSGRASSLIIGSYRHRALARKGTYRQKLASSRRFEGEFSRPPRQGFSRRKAARKVSKSPKRRYQRKGLRRKAQTGQHKKARKKSAISKGYRSTSRRHPVRPRPYQGASGSVPKREAVPSYLPPVRKRYRPQKAAPLPETRRQPEATQKRREKESRLLKRKSGRKEKEAATSPLRRGKTVRDRLLPAGEGGERVMMGSKRADRKAANPPPRQVRKAVIAKRAAEPKKESVIRQSVDSFFDLLAKQKMVAATNAKSTKEPGNVSANKRSGQQKPVALKERRPELKGRGGLMGMIRHRREKPAGGVKPRSGKLVRLVPQKITRSKPEVKGVAGRLVLGDSGAGWGAVAYVPSGKFAVAIRQQGIAQARKSAATALREYTRKPHRVVTINDIQCAAIAWNRLASDDTLIFVNRGVSLKTATQTALQRCRLNAGGRRSNCQIRYWFCADGRMSSGRP